MSGSSNLVFFVDDEPKILSAVQRSLADEAWLVRTFSTPEDALVRIAQEPPAVLVSDFYMPSMKGSEFLAKVRHLDDSIIRMVLTGKPDLNAVLKSVEQGAIHKFLIKPWTDEQLKDAIRDAMLQRDLRREQREAMEQIHQNERKHRQRALRLEAEMQVAKHRKT